MARLSPEEVISYPVMSEDSVKLIETENKITFIIDGRANKNDVRRAVEELYEVEVWKVHTLTALMEERRPTLSSAQNPKPPTWR